MPERYRFSVTDIDAFERYLSRDDVSDEEMLSHLNRTRPSNMYAEVGRAFHSLMENSQFYSLFREARNALPAAAMSLCTESEDASLSLWTSRKQVYHEMLPQPPDVAEMEVSGTYRMNDGTEVLLVGVLDAVWGHTVGDYKLMFSPARTAMGFLDAFQWRAYLDMMGPNYTFRYDAWNVQMHQGPPQMGPGGTRPGNRSYEIGRHTTSGRLPYYPTIHQDVTDRIANLVSWCRNKGWDGSEKQRRYENGQDPAYTLSALPL